jgi:GGDEF domain-containing protein
VQCAVDVAVGALEDSDAIARRTLDAALVAVHRAGEAHEAAEHLRGAVADARLGVTVSVGVAVAGGDEPDASVLARADRALYVKARGRDGVAVAAGAPPPLARGG